MMMMSRNILSISGSSSPYYYYYLVVLLLLSSFPSPVVSEFLYDPNCGIVGVAQVFWAMFGLKDCTFFEAMDGVRITMWVCVTFAIILVAVDKEYKETLFNKVILCCFAILYATFFEFFTVVCIVVGICVLIWRR